MDGPGIYIFTAGIALPIRVHGGVNFINQYFALGLF